MNKNIVKYLIPSFLIFLICSRFLPQPATSAIASSQAGNLNSPTIRPVILTDSWPIKKVVSISSGDLVFAGGEFLNGADGLVLVTADRILKLAATGDPVPGSDGLFLAAVGIKGMTNPPFGEYYGDFSLNARGELGFSANIVNCDSPSNIFQCSLSLPQREGLFLFSEKSKTTIALQGDTAPGVPGATFRSFDRILLNNNGTLVFTAEVMEEEGTKTIGIFSYSQSRIEKIVVSGDVTPLGEIDFLDFLQQPYYLKMFLNDEGTVDFIGYLASDLKEYRGLSLFRYGSGIWSRLLAQTDPAPGGGSLGSIFELNMNRFGDTVFHAGSGLYFRRRDGVLSGIIHDGDQTPIGGQFALFGMCSLNYVPVPLGPLINDSGEVIFGSPIGWKGNAAIFQYSQGQINKIVADGDPIPGEPNSNITYQTGFTNCWGPLTAFFSNRTGMAAFAAEISGVEGSLGVFAYGKGNLFKIYGPGDVAPGTDGESFKGIRTASLSDSGDVTFNATVCCGRYKEGIFRATFPHVEIPNGSFEILGDKGLPANWQTGWSNLGSGEASQFSCGTGCAFDGTSVLRLHVNPGGGSSFILSDPIPISPDAALLITSQMRYYLDSDSDAVYFSIIQSDNAGKTLGFDEVIGTREDNSWVWVPKGMLIRTKPGATSMRIRIGLATGSESYLDVDAVR